MASETNLLEAIFGPSIPIEQATVLPEIMGHIRAIEDLLQGKPRASRPKISDPAVSQPINARIVELYKKIGDTDKIWPEIAARICQEFSVEISPDACRGRHKDVMARQEAATRREAYAALSGKAIDKPDHNADAKKLILASQEPAQEVAVDPIVDPKPGQQVAQRPSDRQIEAIKAEVIKLYQEEPAPLTEAEIDSELIRLRDTGMSPKEIRDAMHHRGVDFGLVELKDRLSVLARKALQDRKDARQASEPEIPANCSRAELDAVMWQLWDHGKGKTLDEISDLLCNNGYSYGTSAVERRLRQQGAVL